MNNRPRRKYFIAAGVLAVLTFIFFGLSFFAPTRDFFAAMSYRPSEFSSALITSLDLTDTASLTYRATHPDFIEDNFADYCTTDNPDSAVLGCYTGGRIYVYRIDDPKLPGITESTTAHELLHALWERLSGTEQNALLSELNQVYKDHYQDLKIIDTYPPAAQSSELYARVGTEITDIPSILEDHFAQHFNDRAKIVAFYAGYAKVFSELSSALKTLETEVANLAATISAETAEYQTSAEVFSRAVDEFNSCAATPGCFANTSAFNHRRSELVTEQNRLNNLYSQMENHISRHNRLVDEYNNNLIRQKDLTSIINSNKENTNVIQK